MDQQQLSFQIHNLPQASQDLQQKASPEAPSNTQINDGSAGSSPNSKPIQTPSLPSSDADNSWKIVGSPPRKGSMPLFSYMNSKDSDYEDSTGLPTPRTQSFSAANDLDFNPNRFQSPSMTPPNAFRRSSVATDPNWGSFSPFQWSRSSMWSDNQASEPSANTHVRKHSLPLDNGFGRGFGGEDLRSSPMIPDVSQDPIYREKRSSSFSVGQSKPGLAFEENSDDQMKLATSRFPNAFQSSLAPMSEEEEDDDFNAARFRARSKSSGAAFGLLSSSELAYMHQLNHPFHSPRASEPYVNEQPPTLGNGSRRPSVIGSPTFDMNPLFKVPAGSKEPLPLLRPQRRFSFATDVPQMSGPPKESATAVGPMNMIEHRRQSISTEPIGANLQTGLNDAMTKLNLETASVPESGLVDDAQPRQHGGEVGKGVPLHQLQGHRQLYMVEFKAGRTDIFYVDDPSGNVVIQTGDLVIVEADRGKDLGKVTIDNLTTQQVSMLQAQQQFEQQMVADNDPSSGSSVQRKDIHPKRIYRLAQPNEITSLVNKGEDETKARLLCQNKVRQKKLPMEVVDAEYQWDRRKLTFYFVADRRIDFRELVRDLFKIYKTRIW
ncbi:hypothetical protein INT44_006666, partial [Umbelopsis vinacea]